MDITIAQQSLFGDQPLRSSIKTLPGNSNIYILLNVNKMVLTPIEGNAVNNIYDLRC
jgi:hypothetical protein